MFKTQKNLAKGVQSSRAIKNSFVVKCYQFMMSEDKIVKEILELIKGYEDESFETVLKDADRYFEKIGSKDSRLEQVKELRKAILEYLEEKIQSVIYFDKKWTEDQRKRIGRFLLPQLEENKIHNQERGIYVTSTLAFYTFVLVGQDLYKDKNSWANEYSYKFRSHVENSVNKALDDATLTFELYIKAYPFEMRELLRWQENNIYLN